MNYNDKSKQSTCWPFPSWLILKNDGLTSFLLGKSAKPVQRRALSKRELHWFEGETIRAIGIEDFVDHSMITRIYSGRGSRYSIGWLS